jgi:2-amino-4-hydroxy-6-hydroxymethyldihydropteridine diphosphokinase
LLASGKVLIGFGANSPGPWGAPEETFRRALSELARNGVRIEAISGLYRTAALGTARQPAYFNAVAKAGTALPPPALLRLLKQIEVRAGRRGGRPWGARTLDLDILDYKGFVWNWQKRREGPAFSRRRPLILPHPELERRPFVLKPLMDIAPGWRHPALKTGIKALWHRVPKGGPGSVLERAEGAL